MFAATKPKLAIVTHYFSDVGLAAAVRSEYDGPTVIAMGAEDGDGHKVWYSACGPNSNHPKPDFVATIPFPSLWRERPFAGTSAAAPQGSAQAALWWSRHPNWTANQILLVRSGHCTSTASRWRKFSGSMADRC